MNIDQAHLETADFIAIAEWRLGELLDEYAKVADNKEEIIERRLGAEAAYGLIKHYRKMLHRDMEALKEVALKATNEAMK